MKGQWIPKARLNLGLAAGLTVLPLIGAAPVSGATPASPQAVNLDITPSQNPDAIGLAAVYGISVSDAGKRLQQEKAAGVLDDALSKAIPNTFAGLYIEDSATFHVVVLTTDPVDDTVVAAEAGKLALADFVDVRPARWSLAQLLADVRSVVAANTGTADVDVDVFNNHVRVRTLAAASLRSDASTGLPASAEVEVVPMLSRPTELYGGAHLSLCTAGFSVFQIGSPNTKGVTTAGHCANSQTWFGQTLTFKAERWSGSNDSQWHTLPGETVTAKIRDSAGGSWRYIFSQVPSNLQALGANICHYGKTTGYGCGRLSSKTIAPSWVPNANPTFGLIARTTASPGDLSSPGDSGGPIFSSSDAWGTTSGEWFSADFGCACNNVYAPVNYISGGMNISVLIQP